MDRNPISGKCTASRTACRVVSFAVLLALLCVFLCSCSFSLESALSKVKAYINGDEPSEPPVGFVESRENETYKYDVYEGYAVLTAYKGEALQVQVPATIDGLPVRRIASLAFYEGAAIEELVLPEGVTELEENALYYCTSLKKLTLPESLTKLGDKCFSWCGALTEVTLPKGITELPAYCFNQCTSLQTLTVKGTLNAVGVRAFSGCTSLQNAPFTQTLHSVGDYAFRGCTLLESLTLPGDCTVGQDAFDGCAEHFSVVTAQGSACWNACLEAGVAVRTPSGDVVGNTSLPDAGGASSAASE